MKRAAPTALTDAIERALAPYKRLLSAETIETMRAEALLQLAAHPYPAALAQALTTPPVLQGSDVVPNDGARPNGGVATAAKAQLQAVKKGVA